MAKARIERLTLRHFRGGCQPVTFEFAKDKNIVLVFGENGAGKSSIADALDFVCNGEFGSLRDRSGVTPRMHVVSLDASAKDLEVELVFGGQTWRASLQGGKPKTTPAGAPRAFVLRRSDIARVMESTPSDRYKALQAYITVPRVERTEGELRRATKEIKDEVANLVKERQSADAMLERFWHAEGEPGGTPLAWAIEQTSEDTTILNNRLAATRTVVERLDRLIDARNQIAAAQQLLADVRTKVAQVEQRLDQVRDVVQGANDALVAVLEDAKTYLEETPAALQACPVCGKPEARDALVARVDGALRQLSDLKRLRDERNRYASALEQAEGAVAAARNRLRESSAHFVEGLRAVPPAVTVDGSQLAALLSSATGATVKQVASAIDTVALRRPLLVAALEADQRTLNQHNALKSHLHTIVASVQKLRHLEALSLHLEQLLQVVETERKRYVGDLMADIARSVDDLYGRIHPKEPLGRPYFSMKAQTSGSLELKARFGDQTDVAPTAYYSEAHLDTLGLCVYLALAKHAGAGNALVVLDDVLTSVDDMHLDRIIAVIADEAAHFGQMIMMTHSRACFDRMRISSALPADLIELYGWDLQTGIRYRRSP